MSKSKEVAYLRVVRGPQKGGVFVLRNLSVFDIGRGDECNVCLEDDSICSSHARIYRRGTTWTFYDLNSEGGSCVNDIPVSKRDLDGGEVIRIGAAELHFSFSPPQSNKKSSADPIPRQQQAATEAPPEQAAPPSPPVQPAAPAAPVEPSPLERAVASLEAEAAAAPPEPTRPAPAREPSPSHPAGGDEPTDGFLGLDLAVALDQQASRAGPALTFKMRVIDGDPRDLGKNIVLDPQQEYILGRSTGCSLVLNDGKVSRQHCRLEPAPEGFKVIDLNSANGSVLNGERVSQMTIKTGDYLRIGFTVVTFEVTPVLDSQSGDAQPAVHS